ncbi:MAG: acyloxyacyl hydrolase [Prolixibacteraceae bacterium]
MFIKKFLLVLVLCALITTSGLAETEKTDSLKVKRELLFRAFYQNGKVFKTNDFLRYNNLTADDIDRFHSISIQALWQTNGIHQWEKDFGYPRLGVGIWAAQFFDAPNLGTPFAFYGLFNAPFIQGKNWSWRYELEMGLATNWNDFNPISNKQNLAIGADQTVYLDLGFYFEYKLSTKLSIEIGLSTSHFSNGALKLPNKGINTMAPKFIIQYRPSETNYVKTLLRSIQENEKYEIQFSLYGGSKNVLYTGNDIDSISKYKGVYFPQTGIMTSVHRQIGQKSKLGVGISVGYNASADARILIDGTKLDEENATFKKGFEVNIFPSYELVIDRVSVVIQPGFYLYRQNYQGRRPTVYQRVGIKYHFLSDVFAGISLRAYDYHISDFIEWNIGYRLPLRNTDKTSN